MTTELPANPESREESYLAKIAGQNIELPEKPLSRKEQYLAYIAENGASGGGGGEDEIEFVDLTVTNISTDRITVVPNKTTAQVKALVDDGKTVVYRLVVPQPVGGFLAGTYLLQTVMASTGGIFASAVTTPTPGGDLVSYVYVQATGASNGSIYIKNVQDALVSGTNIKTINNQSILGNGNITIEGGSGGGLSSVAHDDTMTGAGTNASPLKVNTTKIAQKSDIPDTSNFITKSVDDLTNYTKTSDLGSLATKNTVNYETEVTNKPTIPSQVTEETVSGWGFTKNTGTYSKPSGGIPKSDLSSAVQTSLGKADTSIQPNDLINYQLKPTTQNIAETSATIAPIDNTIYQCGELTSLTITNPPADGMYIIIFTSGATPTTTTIPTTIHGFDDFAAEANMRYEINVLNNYALIAGWEVTV